MMKIVNDLLLLLKSNSFTEVESFLNTLISVQGVEKTIKILSETVCELNIDKQPEKIRGQLVDLVYDLIENDTNELVKAQIIGLLIHIMHIKDIRNANISEDTIYKCFKSLLFNDWNNKILSSLIIKGFAINTVLGIKMWEEFCSNYSSKTIYPQELDISICIKIGKYTMCMVIEESKLIADKFFVYMPLSKHHTEILAEGITIEKYDLVYRILKGLITTDSSDSLIGIYSSLSAFIIDIINKTDISRVHYKFEDFLVALTKECFDDYIGAEILNTLYLRYPGQFRKRTFVNININDIYKIINDMKTEHNDMERFVNLFSIVAVSDLEFAITLWEYFYVKFSNYYLTKSKDKNDYTYKIWYSYAGHGSSIEELKQKNERIFNLILTNTKLLQKIFEKTTDTGGQGVILSRCIEFNQTDGAIQCIEYCIKEGNIKQIVSILNNIISRSYNANVYGITYSQTVKSIIDYTFSKISLEYKSALLQLSIENGKEHHNNVTDELLSNLQDKFTSPKLYNGIPNCISQMFAINKEIAVDAWIQTIQHFEKSNKTVDKIITDNIFDSLRFKYDNNTIRRIVFENEIIRNALFSRCSNYGFLIYNYSDIFTNNDMKNELNLVLPLLRQNKNLPISIEEIIEKIHKIKREQQEYLERTKETREWMKSYYGGDRDE